MRVPDLSTHPHWQPLIAALPLYIDANGLSHRRDSAIIQAEQHAGICPLDQLALYDIEGVDAVSFLQGQLSCDVEKLGIGETTLAAHCNAKGRMHANFLLHRLADQHFLIQLPRSVVTTAQQALARYAVFSKVTLNRLDERYIACGILASTADSIRETLAAVATFGIKLGDIGDVFWFDTEDNAALSTLDEALRAGPLGGSADWTLATHRAGVGFVEAATVLEFIPQVLNLDQLGGISFDKGCYTGQEIIARMKYLGKTKRRMQRFSIDHAKPVAINIGETLFDASGAKTASVVSAVSYRVNDATDRYRTDILAVALWQDGTRETLTVKAPAGKLNEAELALRGQSLPYRLADT